MHLRTLFKTLFCLLIDSLFQLLSALNRNEISGEKWKYGGQIPSDGHFFVVGFDISLKMKWTLKKTETPKTHPKSTCRAILSWSYSIQGSYLDYPKTRLLWLLCLPIELEICAAMIVKDC